MWHPEIIIIIIIIIYFYYVRTWRVILFKFYRHWLKTFMQISYPVDDEIIRLIFLQIFTFVTNL
jgi:hypothetical protein